MKYLSGLLLTTALLGAAFSISILCVFNELYFSIFNLDKTALQFLQGSISAQELKETNIEGFFFTRKEIKHFQDVKAILDSIILLLPILILPVIILFHNAPKLGQKIALISIGIQTLFLGALTAIYALGFWKPFTRTLHPIFFPDGNWQFPSQSLIIKLYPQTVMQIGLAIILGLTLLQILSVYILNKKVNRLH